MFVRKSTAQGGQRRLCGTFKDKCTNHWMKRIEEEAAGKLTAEQATSHTECGGEENPGAHRPASR